MTRVAVALFARSPSSGGKSRLATHLSEARHLTLRGALLADALDVICGPHRCEPFVFFTPDTAREEMTAIVAARATLVPQRGGDLGERMHRGLSELLGARGFRSALLVGSDVPLLSADDITAAADALGQSPVVIGPADDGGYYLIGMNAPHGELFDRVGWGTGDVFSETLTRARAMRTEPAMIRRLYDVDTIDDLHRAARDLLSLPPRVAPHLRAWLTAETLKLES